MLCCLMPNFILGVKMKQPQLLKLLIMSLTALSLLACQGGSDSNVGSEPNQINYLQNHTIYPKNPNFVLEAVTVTNYSLRFARNDHFEPTLIYPNGTQKEPFLIDGNNFTNKHKLEFHYKNIGDPLKLDHIKFVLGNEYKLVVNDKDSCYNHTKGEIPTGAKCKITAEGNLKSMEANLPTNGSYYFKVKVPVFAIDEGGVEPIDYIPERLFEDIEDAQNVSINVGYLNMNINTYRINNGTNSVALIASIVYSGQLSYSYKYLPNKEAYYVLVSFPKLSGLYRELGNSGCNKYSETNEKIIYKCDLVVGLRNGYGIPTRIVKVEFGTKPGTAFQNLFGNKHPIVIKPPEINSQILTNETKKHELVNDNDNKDEFVIAGFLGWSSNLEWWSEYRLTGAMRGVILGWSFKYFHDLKAELDSIAIILNKLETGCVEQIKCSVKLPKSIFDKVEEKHGEINKAFSVEIPDFLSEEEKKEIKDYFSNNNNDLNKDINASIVMYCKNKRTGEVYPFPRIVKYTRYQLKSSELDFNCEKFPFDG